MGEGKVGSRVENRKAFWWKILNLSSPLVKVREREKESYKQTSRYSNQKLSPAGLLDFF